jgi:hypothetical protein
MRRGLASLRSCLCSHTTTSYRSRVVSSYSSMLSNGNTTQATGVSDTAEGVLPVPAQANKTFKSSIVASECGLLIRDSSAEPTNTEGKMLTMSVTLEPHRTGLRMANPLAVHTASSSLSGPAVLYRTHAVLTVRLGSVVFTGWD